MFPAPSRVEVATGRLAKLDHVITWELQLQASTGIAEWPGGTDQDHARAGFWVGTEIFGDAIKSQDGKRKQIPRIRRKQIEAIQDSLNSPSETAGTILVHRPSATCRPTQSELGASSTGGGRSREGAAAGRKSAQRTCGRKRALID